MPKCIILGAGGHAKVVLESLRLMGGVEVIGILDKEKTSSRMFFDGIPILGDDTALEQVYAQGADTFIIAIGSVRSGLLREELFELGEKAGLKPMSVIHPSSFCAASAAIEDGVQLFAGCIVNSGAQLGRNVIVNCGAIVEHDCKIADHVHIASGACLCGDVKVGKSSHIGARSVILQGVCIGRSVTVGAGAVVLKDVPDFQTVVGVPARSPCGSAEGNKSEVIA